MAYLGVAARGAGREITARTAAGPLDLDEALRRAIARLPPAAPIVILVHGYKFDPADPAKDPHRSLFSLADRRPCWKVRSWPHGLGLAGGPDSGLAIGFGWPAAEAHLPALLSEGRTGFARVYDRAAEAGADLAALLARIARPAPWRRIDIVAHSLGARVALAALPHLERAPGRIVLLGAAEFDARALEHLAAGPARAPAIYNVTARANDIYDLMFETFAPRRSWRERAVGLGLRARLPNWLDLQLDSPAVTDWVNARGIALAPPSARLCHWSFYTRPGAFAVYRAILARAPGWDIPSLRTVGAFAAQEPRWSRLVPRRRPAVALPPAAPGLASRLTTP
jgi:pimeloyl-ACP methyl ester carboxylesterase